MNERPSHRCSVAIGAMLIAFAIGGGPVLAESTPTPAPPAPTSDDKKKRKQSQFIEGYKLAYNLIQSGEYEAGIVALRALEEDGHADVANYIGFASRKLGRYDDAKFWYEKALAADPKHVRTWQYYGMWHVEQGNMLKAADHLKTINLLCGTTCKEYVDLKGSMEGTVSY